MRKKSSSYNYSQVPAMEGSTKDILEDQDLALLTHNSKLQSGGWIFFETPENASLQTSFLRGCQTNIQVIKRGHAFDFNEMQLPCGGHQNKIDLRIGRFPAPLEQFESFFEIIMKNSLF